MITDEIEMVECLMAPSTKGRTTTQDPLQIIKLHSADEWEQFIREIDLVHS